jgi:hypothetical protein
VKAPSRVCLTCRTLYLKNEECRGKKHRTVSIVSQSGRSELDDEVWGPDSRARAMRQAAKAGAGGGAAGALDWCGGGCGPLDACDGLTAGGELGGLLAGIVLVIIGALIGIVLFFVIRALVRWLREKLRRPVPHGALQAAPKLKKGVTSISGLVRAAGEKLELPWKSDRSAYAWAMELHAQRVLGGGAMLRDARTSGFSLQLDDGRSLRIPAGRIRVVSPLARVEDADIAQLEGMVNGIDRARGGARTVFPFEYARGVTIEEGDRVEVLGELAPDPDAQGGGYRQNAGGFVPVGVPYLRVEKAQKVRVAPELPPPATPEEGGVAEAEAEAIEEERKAER